MNATEQLLATVEKTARHTERTTVLLFEPNADEPNADEPQLAWHIHQPDRATWLRTWLDGAGWYGDDADDEAMDHLQPWPDYNTRI
jgi:hypothetical protein